MKETIQAVLVAGWGIAQPDDREGFILRFLSEVPGQPGQLAPTSESFFLCRADLERLEAELGKTLKKTRGGKRLPLPPRH